MIRWHRLLEYIKAMLLERKVVLPGQQAGKQDQAVIESPEEAAEAEVRRAQEARIKACCAELHMRVPVYSSDLGREQALKRCESNLLNKRIADASKSSSGAIKINAPERVRSGRG